MRLNQRIKNVEQRAGADGAADVIIFTTIYENEDGGVDSLSQYAAIMRPGNKMELVNADVHESEDQFHDRVNRIARFSEINEQSERK